MVDWLSASNSVQSSATTISGRGPTTNGTQEAKRFQTSTPVLEKNRSTCVSAARTGAGGLPVSGAHSARGFQLLPDPDVVGSVRSPLPTLQGERASGGAAGRSADRSRPPTRGCRGGHGSGPSTSGRAGGSGPWASGRARGRGRAGSPRG